MSHGFFNNYSKGGDNMSKNIKAICWKRVKDLYGKKPEERVKNRLNKELSLIYQNESSEWYEIAKDIVDMCESDGYHVFSRYSTAGAFVNYLCGISEINPLEPHYRCPNCKYVEFVDDDIFKIGYDLSLKSCPSCGENMIADGVNIPMESYFGLKESRRTFPHIYLGVPAKYCEASKKKFETIYGQEEFIDDVMPHWGLEMYRDLEKFTSIKVQDISLSYSFFRVGLYNCDFLEENLKSMISYLKPKTFEELVRTLALYHSTGAWKGTGQLLYNRYDFFLKDLICVREDVMEYMLKLGASREDAYYFMEYVRKGLGADFFFKEEGQDFCKKYELPSWFIATTSNIKYLPLKAHMVSYAMMIIRLSWYKQNYPQEFCWACPIKCKDESCKLQIKCG